MNQKIRTNLFYYYNCRSAQYLNALLQKNELYSSLFFNVFENTENIYENLFVQKIDRWRYRNSTVYRNLPMNNIVRVNEQFTQYEDLENYIVQVFDQGIDILFVWANSDYLPHREFGKHYFEKDAVHSVLLKGYKMVDGKPYFLMEDDSPTFFDYIPGDMVRDFIFTDTPDWAKEVSYLQNLNRDGESRTLIEQQINDAFPDYVAQLNDEFIFYDRIENIVAGKGIASAFHKQTEIFDFLNQAFSMIAGSRFLFSLYIESQNHLASLATTLRESSLLSETLRNGFIRAARSGRFNQDMVRERCDRLKKLEEYVLQQLKSQAV